MDNADTVLDEAKEFMVGRAHASWEHYNYFKQKLINAGCYGHERELADILKL